MPRTPPWLQRFNPMRALLEDRGELAEILPEVEEKTLTLTNTGDLIFGDIAVDTSVRVGFEYEATSTDTLIIGCVIHYDGDDGAFQITGNEFTMTFADPIDLANGVPILWMIPPSTYSETSDLIITALAADDGVEKTGTLTICDRADFADGASPERTLRVVDLSKRYVAP